MSALPQSIDIGPTLGVAFIGALLSSTFYGVTTLQAIFYFNTYPKDGLALKALVLGLWVLDTLDVSFVAHALYTYFITDFMNPMKLQEMVWTIVSEPIVAGTVALIVHQFLIYRIWVFDRRLVLLAIFLSVFSVFLYSLSIVAIVKFIKGGGQWNGSGDFRWIITLASVSNGILDLVLAGMTCYLFLRGGKYDMSTQRMLNRLSVYTISTGVLTSLISAVSFIVSLAMPTSFANQALTFMLSKAYTNTMMASLNARQSLQVLGRKHDTGELYTGNPVSSVMFAGSSTQLGGRYSDRDVELLTQSATHLHLHTETGFVKTEVN